MHKATFNQARVAFRLRPLTPLLIKSGDKGAALLHPERPDMMFVRTNRGGTETVYLPGASLKGVVRSTAERVLRSLQPTWACDPLDHRSPCANLQRETDTAQIYRGQCRACRTFGSLALSSRALFADAYPGDDATREAANLTEVRSGVAIDRKTGGPAGGKLYEYEVVTGGSFDSEIVLRNYELWQLGLLFLALQELGEGFVRIGSARSRGLGRVAVTYREVLIDQSLGQSLGQGRRGLGRIAGAAALGPADLARTYGLLAPEDDRLPAGPKAAPGALGERFKLTEKDVPDLINTLLDAPWQRLVGAAHAP